MNTTDDENLGFSDADTLVRPIRWVRWTALAVAILLIGLLATGWFLRKTVAERALAGWCAERALTCEGKFVRIGSDGATIRGLKVSAGEADRGECAEFGSGHNDRCGSARAEQGRARCQAGRA